MSFTSRIEEVNSTRRKFHIAVEPTIVTEAFSAAIQEVTSTANVRGFRKGKVPPALVKKFFGEDVRKKALERVINRTYQGAVGKTDLQVVSYPHIENDGAFEEGNQFKYTATVDVNPMIDIKGYKDVVLKDIAKKADDAAVTEEITKLAKAVATYEKVEEKRAVQKSDVAIVTYQGELDGKPLKNSTASHQRLDLSRAGLMPEFEKAVVGAKVGDEKTFSVSYPKDAKDKILAGKTVQFKLTVEGIEKQILPTLDDEFAKRFGTPTLEDMKKSMKEIIERGVEQERMESFQEQLIEQILAKNDFEVPESLIENTVDRAIEMANKENPGQKLDSANEEVRNRYRDWAKGQVRGVLALGHVARAESITVDDNELGPELVSVARSYGMDPQTLVQKGGQQIVEEVRGRVLLSKTVKHLSKVCKVEAAK